MAAAINDMAEELGLRLEQVTAEKEQLHAVLAGMVEGVLVLDTDGCVTLANPRLREMLSLWGPVEGRKLLEVVRHPGIDDALRAAAESTAPVVSEVEVGERTPRTLLIHAAVFPQEGPAMGTVAVFHDVTELRHLENVRRDFVANASHELQTPLAAIRGFAETLVGNDLSWEEVRAQLDVILRNSARLENLIRDMRELSRVESRRVPLQPGEVDVLKLAGALLADMELRLKERSLEVSVADRGAVSAWADRRAVDQVLTNLVDNALKYTDPGGRITVEVESQPDPVRVSVSDTGIGIPAEQQARNLRALLSRRQGALPRPGRDRARPRHRPAPGAGDGRGCLRRERARSGIQLPLHLAPGRSPIRLTARRSSPPRRATVTTASPSRPNVPAT